MPTTGTELIARIRDVLDEATPAQWPATQINRWINDGLNDVSRSTMHLQDVNSTLFSVAGTSEYTAPASVLRIDAAYFTTSDGRIVPLVAVNYEGVDQVWGSYQNQTSGNPSMFTTWGFQPQLKVKLYPTPNTSGNQLRLMVRRMATLIAIDGSGNASNLDFPEVWVDLLVHYVEFRARRKTGDPQWQEAKQLFEEGKQSLMDHEYTNELRQIVHDPMAGGLPRWLVDPNY